jgi:hypothetical protein
MPQDDMLPQDEARTFMDYIDDLVSSLKVARAAAVLFLNPSLALARFLPSLPPSLSPCFSLFSLFHQCESQAARAATASAAATTAGATTAATAITSLLCSWSEAEQEDIGKKEEEKECIAGGNSARQPADQPSSRTWSQVHGPRTWTWRTTVWAESRRKPRTWQRLAPCWRRLRRLLRALWPVAYTDTGGKTGRGRCHRRRHRSGQ